MEDLGHSRRPRQIVYMTVAGMALFMAAIFSGYVTLDSSDDFIVKTNDGGALATAAVHAAAVSASVEGMGNFFLAIHTGLFVLVGFAINASLKNSERVEIAAHLALGAFVLSSLIVFYLSFLARFQVLERVDAGHPDFGSVLDTIAIQGVALSISSLFAICAAGLMLVHSRGEGYKSRSHATEPDGEGKIDATIENVAGSDSL